MTPLREGEANNILNDINVEKKGETHNQSNSLLANNESHPEFELGKPTTVNSVRFVLTSAASVTPLIACMLSILQNTALELASSSLAADILPPPLSLANFQSCCCDGPDLSSREQQRPWVPIFLAKPIRTRATTHLTFGKVVVRLVCRTYY